MQKENKVYFEQLTTILFFTTLFLVINSCSTAITSADISGELTEWHKVVLRFGGPSTSETAIPNPFTDYRLDVTFTGPNGQAYEVPGYYAADGGAGESSADSGNIWQVNFCPDMAGDWSYSVSFVSGPNIATQLTGGESAGFFDGETGQFVVAKNTNTGGKDFRNKGKLTYVDDHFLQFQGTGEYFVKGGANSPEVFLEYAEFDNTDSDRLYPEHIRDWQEGDPYWKDKKGKGILGAVNYLSSIDINAYYFLPMNAYGDGKKAWPWIHQDSIVRYDCSKLDQWDVVFRHMNEKGILVHFVLSETENESYFELREEGETGGFANSRKIYYREMIARYGYLPAVSWNVGEENGWAEGEEFHIANTDQQRKDFIEWVRTLTYYDDMVSIHNGPSWDDHIYTALLGNPSMSGPAFQWDYSQNIYSKIQEWRNKSIEAGHKWVVNFDEPYIDDPTGDLDDWRIENVWATFMAGGAGIELYIGKGLDLKVQDFRKYEAYYKTMGHATNFLSTYVPIQEVKPDSLFSENAWTLRNGDDLFLLYLKNAERTTLDLPENNYEISWFNPRTGGKPVSGSVDAIDGGANIAIGVPPNEAELDWACLITKTNQ